MSAKTIQPTKVATVIIPVADQDAAVDFYVDKLGFEKRVDVDEQVSRMGDPVPPMFWFRDPEGNTLMVVG